MLIEVTVMNNIRIFAHQINDLLNAGVNPIIVILLIPAILIVPLFVFKLVLSRKTYRCTECGKIFKPKFLRTHIGLHDQDGINQYCPKCKDITWCKYE